MPTPTWWDDLLAISDMLASEDRADAEAWRGGSPAEGSVSAVEGAEDVPPLTLRLANLGRAFAERATELTQDQCKQVLALLENVEAHGSEYDSTAVATGFFESLLNAWDSGFDLKSVWRYVGPECRAYCVAWNDFNGVESPAWMRTP